MVVAVVSPLDMQLSGAVECNQEDEAGHTAFSLDSPRDVFVSHFCLLSETSTIPPTSPAPANMLLISLLPT